MAEFTPQQIADAINYHDNALAWEILVQAKKQPDLKIGRHDFLQLNYVRMNSLDEGRLLGFLKESVLAAYEIPQFDLEKHIIDYVESLDYIPAQIEFITQMRSILEQHQEQLGDKKITVGDKIVGPTIANWIADYNNVISAGDHTVVGELRYLNTSANPKTLSPEQREILKQLLNLYDRLVQYSDFWNSLPDQLSEGDLQDFDVYLQKEFEKEYKEEPVAPASIDALENTQVVGEPIPEAGIFSEQVEGAENPAKRPSEEQRRIMQDVTAHKQPGASYGNEGANIRDLINRKTRIPQRGIVWDEGTNVELDEEKKRLHDARQQKTTDIQSKLEDLRKRHKDNA